MKTTTRYVMRNIPHPWDAARRDGGVMAWCICRETTIDESSDWQRPIDVVPVAMFNLDSEALTFQIAVHRGHIVALDRETTESLSQLDLARAKARSRL